MRTLGLVRCLALIVGLSACSQNHALPNEADPGAPIPRPDHIFVAYFAMLPEQVTLDQGVSARFVRTADDRPLPERALRALRPLQASVAEGVVNRLKTYGLSAEIATNNSGSGSGLLVQGQIVSINRGKTTKRALIGLGTVGGIEADTQLYDLADTGPPRFLMALEGQTANGGAPDADRLADAVAKRIRGFAVARGWIQPGDVKRDIAVMDADR